MTAPIWLLGAGNMGGALLRGWLAEGMGPVAVIDPALPAMPDGVAVAATPPAGHPDVLVLAVKPQIWWAATETLADIAGPTTLVVSIMAGVTTADLAQRFPNSAIVRAMPNTPAAIGAGMTALFTTAGDLAEGAAAALFGPAGAMVWLRNENDFDAVTAVSGSGPGYVFAFIEALAAAAQAQGLAPDMAMQLARATVTGAAALAVAEGGLSAGELRQRVTSPGGTTAAGLAVLTPSLDDLLAQTVAAAAARSRRLALPPV